MDNIANPPDREAERGKELLNADFGKGPEALAQYAS